MGSLPHPDGLRARSITAAAATSKCAGSIRSGARPSGPRRGRRRPRRHPVGVVRHGRLALAADPPRGPLDVGAFDIRAPEPRPTLIAKAAAALGRRRAVRPSAARPAAAGGGGPGRTYARPRVRRAATVATRRRPILITGATGTLGQAFARICAHRGLAHRADRPRRARHHRRRVDRRRDRAARAVGDDQHRRFRPRPRSRAKHDECFRDQCRRPRAASPARARRWACRWSHFPPTWCSTASSAAPTSSPTRRARQRLRAQQGRGRKARPRR